MLIDLFDFIVLKNWNCVSNMFLFNNLYELLTIVSNLFHRKKIDFELWKTVSNLYKCFEIKMNSFLGYSGEISNKS